MKQSRQQVLYLSGFEDIKSGAKGYFHVEDNRIAINKGMSEIQTVKTAIHEMAHAKLHNLEAQKDNKQSKNSKEVEALYSAFQMLIILKNAEK